MVAEERRRKMSESSAAVRRRKRKKSGDAAVRQIKRKMMEQLMLTRKMNRQRYLERNDMNIPGAELPITHYLLQVDLD